MDKFVALWGGKNRQMISTAVCKYQFLVLGEEFAFKIEANASERS